MSYYQKLHPLERNARKKGESYGSMLFVAGKLQYLTMNRAALFSRALGLQPPWQVKAVAFSANELARSELHLRIGFVPGSRFMDGKNEPCPMHDVVEQLWQNLNFFEHVCYLHCAVPRIITADGKFHTVKVPWAQSGSGFTLLT